MLDFSIPAGDPTAHELRPVLVQQAYSNFRNAVRVDTAAVARPGDLISILGESRDLAVRPDKRGWMRLATRISRSGADEEQCRGKQAGYLGHLRSIARLRITRKGRMEKRSRKLA